MQYFPITQASLITLLTAVVGQVVAFVPSLAPREQTLISLGSILISVAFLIANAIHAHASARRPAPSPSGKANL